MDDSDGGREINAAPCLEMACDGNVAEWDVGHK
jgi:hypothetical protein